MAREIHLFRNPDRFIVGTVGQPGDRTFYLQAEHERRIVTVLAEKQQIQILTDRSSALLEEIHRRFGTEFPPKSRDILDLAPLSLPIDSEFRVGTMGLGWDNDSQSVVVELLAVSDGEFDESVVLDDSADGPDALRVFLSPAEVRQFAGRAELILAAGRPPCPLCDRPVDQTGHICVRTNGYHRMLHAPNFIDPDSDGEFS